MSQNLYTLSLDAIKYVLGLISATVDLPNTILDDLNIQTTTTYSSYRLDTLLKALKDENIKYCDEAIAGLNKLSKEIVDDSSKVVKENTIYLILTNPVNNVYEQWLLINGTPQMIGTTEMNLDSVYTKDEADDRYTLITDFNTLVDKVTAIEDEIGTEILTTTSQTITGAINEVKTSVPTDDYIKSLADGQITANSVDYVSSYVDKSLIPNMSLIESTYFGSHVPSNTNRTDDPNETTLAIIRTKHANCPTDTMEYIIFTIITDKKFGSEVSFNDIAEKKQIAIASNNYDDIYVRSHAYNSATWTKWKKVCTTSVADVGKTFVPFTVPSSITVYNPDRPDLFGLYYIVKNGVCYVDVTMSLASISQMNNFTTLCSGIPKPAISYVRNEINSWNDKTAPTIAMAINGGESTFLITARNMSTSPMTPSSSEGHFGYFCSFSYPVAES